MKKSLIILVFLISNIAFSQTYNVLSELQFNNIEINNVKLSDISNSYGDQNVISQLFGPPSTKVIDPDGDFYQYKFKNFDIGFSALLSSDYNKPITSRIELTNSTSTIKINGIEIRIGDNINKLGDVKLNTITNGHKSILYMPCDGCTNFISISFNEVTKLITEIIYIEMT